MVAQYEIIGKTGLLFFGKVSASISHEMKNVLAIINENAGLIEDLSFAARKGAPIELERLDRVAGNFSKQIRRANTILKNLSTFAHSVDQFNAQVDLHELVSLVANLAGRPAAMRKITLETVKPPEPVHLTSNPFLLENLVWLCLDYTIAATSADRTLTLIPEKSNSGICLYITALDGLPQVYPEQLPAGCKEILDALGARLVPNATNSKLTLHLA
jgi:signal transduction histidine kinase